MSHRESRSEYTAVCRDGGFNLEGCETRIIMRWATLLLLLASWRTRISSAPLPPPPPKDAAIAAAAISDAFALFAYNVSGAGSLDCNGLYLPESFFQWSKTPSLALVYPTTFSDAGPWNAGSTLSRQTHGASSYWIVSSPRSGKWLYGQLVAHRQYRPVVSAEWLALSGAEPAPLIQRSISNVSGALHSVPDGWERQVLLSSLLRHFGQEDAAASILWAAVSSDTPPPANVQGALHRRSVLWAFMEGRLQRAREHLTVASDHRTHAVSSPWIDEAACLLALIAGAFSGDELQYYCRISMSDDSASLPFLDDLSNYYHFQVARALAPSILR